MRLKLKLETQETMAETQDTNLAYFLFRLLFLPTCAGGSLGFCS